MSVFAHRYRGFRVLNVIALGVLAVLMLGVYFAKTRASADSIAIDRIERQIRREQESIRALQAQVAALEAPGRIVALSEQRLGMAPVSPAREARPDALAKVAGVQPAAANPATGPGAAP